MDTESVAVGGWHNHSKCHVHRYEDDITVEMDCRLEQECVQVHIECVGPDDPERLLPIVQEYNCEDAGKAITFEFDIPANHLCDEEGEADCGLFCCFTATLTSITLCDRPGHIMCFCKELCVGVHRQPAHG